MYEYLDNDKNLDIRFKLAVLHINLDTNCLRKIETSSYIF